MLQEVIATADTVRHPALAARARWSLSVAMTRQGNHAGIAYARAAEPMFARSGEPEYVGVQQYLDGEGDYDVGNLPVAYRKLTTALGTLRAHRASRWRHNTLTLLASAASKEGFLRAARYIQNEGLTVASRIEQPFYRIEARLARARVATTFGDSALASADLDSARTEIGRLDPGEARRWFEANRRVTEAARVARHEPARAVAELDSVILEPAVAANPVLFLPALVARADAHLTLGHASLATADVQKALNVLDKRRSEIAEAPLRASLLDAAHGVVDRLVNLHLRSGDSIEALAVLERGRASFSTVSTSVPSVSRKTIGHPRGEVAIEYALIGDTLLTWTIADTAVRLVRAPADRSRLLRTIEEARASLELRAADSAVRPRLSTLYDKLIRPIESQVGKDQRVVIIADGEIARVPFAALYDLSRHLYFIESHIIRSAPSLADAVASARSSRGRPSEALLVANTSRVGPLLQSRTDLPAARAELDSIAVRYPKRRILDSHATAESTFVNALSQAEVAHFAGHAAFDDERPERSYLEIGDTKDGSGRLAARQLSALDLHRLRLMVLSACETMPGQSGRSGGFSGFTSALLAAGVRGVVGSLWRVEDEATRDLMTEFHRSYVETLDGPGALRVAQLNLLHSKSVARQSPAAWAGFRYAGR
jgi:CHAT domain-containing protein